MNCDHAFDLMTDPVLDDSAELHGHLNVCPRCRQMYETLAPALGLFAASGREGEEASVDERGSWGGVEIAERVAVRLAREAPARAASLRPRRTLQAWACVLAAGLVLMSAIGLTAPRSGAPAAPSSDQCTWLHREAVPVEARAEAVVLSCVACHAARQQQQQDQPGRLGHAEQRDADADGLPVACGTAGVVVGGGRGERGGGGADASRCEWAERQLHVRTAGRAQPDQP